MPFTIQRTPRLCDCSKSTTSSRNNNVGQYEWFGAVEERRREANINGGCGGWYDWREPNDNNRSMSITFQYNNQSAQWRGWWFANDGTESELWLMKLIATNRLKRNNQSALWRDRCHCQIINATINPQSAPVNNILNNPLTFLNLSFALNPALQSTLNYYDSTNWRKQLEM